MSSMEVAEVTELVVEGADADSGGVLVQAEAPMATAQDTDGRGQPAHGERLPPSHDPQPWRPGRG